MILKLSCDCAGEYLRSVRLSELEIDSGKRRKKHLSEAGERLIVHHLESSESGVVTQSDLRLERQLAMQDTGIARGTQTKAESACG